MIVPEAVDGVIEASDIFFLYNHTSDRGFLARSKFGAGSLHTDVREDHLGLIVPALSWHPFRPKVLQLALLRGGIDE